ncbi:MAG: hypothetical protein D6785_04575 [Planctomycetota bacterium]|nr:MAG: hypothetical protein D6785_04575 [Planctomycetota bacterium]
MSEKHLRTILVVLNALLVGLFYFMIWNIYFKAKKPYSITLITPQDLKIKKKRLEQRKRADSYSIIYMIFGVPKKVVKTPPKPPVPRYTPPPMFQIKVVIFNRDDPEDSRVWIAEGMNVHIMGIGQKYRGFQLKRIQRTLKRKEGYKQEVEYKVVFEKNGQEKEIPFLTWEPMEN